MRVTTRRPWLQLPGRTPTPGPWNPNPNWWDRIPTKKKYEDVPWHLATLPKFHLPATWPTYHFPATLPSLDLPRLDFPTINYDDLPTVNYDTDYSNSVSYPIIVPIGIVALLIKVVCIGVCCYRRRSGTVTRTSRRVDIVPRRGTGTTGCTAGNFGPGFPPVQSRVVSPSGMHPPMYVTATEPPTDDRSILVRNDVTAMSHGTRSPSSMFEAINPLSDVLHPPPYTPGDGRREPLPVLSNSNQETEAPPPYTPTISSAVSSTLPCVVTIPPPDRPENLICLSNEATCPT